MNNQNNNDCQPILIKGLIKMKTVHFAIESLRTRFKRQHLPISIIHKLVYHLVILLTECEKRNMRLLSNISLDTIYVKANDQNDPHVFIAEEDQLFNPIKPQQTAMKILNNIFNQIGINDYCWKNKTEDDILEYLLRKIFQIPLDRKDFCITTEEILQEIYNIKIEKKLYQYQLSLIIAAKTPYYINCERDIIAIKWNKLVIYADEDYLDEFREIKLMEQVVECKNCVKLYGYTKFAKECFYFLRYCDISLNNLAQQINQKYEFPQKQFVHLFTQIALAANNLHQKGIMHRDLNPNYIMFEYAENESIEQLICVIINLDYYKGTYINEAPEGIQDLYDASYEIWQLGHIMLCTQLGKKNTAYQKIKKPIYTEEEYLKRMNPFFDSSKEKFSNWCPLISQMIAYQKWKRPTLGQVIQALQILMNDILKLLFFFIFSPNQRKVFLSLFYSYNNLLFIILLILFMQQDDYQPKLIKGLIKKKTVHFQIESLRTRFQRSLLPTIIIDKMMYHLAILLGELEKRHKRLLSNISLDTIYVKANDQNDPHVFIAEEDELQLSCTLTAKYVLKKICSQMGTRDYFKEKKGTVEDVIVYILKKIFGIPQEKDQWFITTEQILEDIYNIQKEQQIYSVNNISLVLIVKTPYYFNCERDIIALKWTNNPNGEEEKFYEYREIELMEKIVDCKNCAKLFGYSKFKYECFFFLKYYDITLDQLGNKFGKTQVVTQKQFAHLFTQMALAIRDLHSKGIIHRDLKPENIMFEYVQDDSIENMSCVLIDFDRSKGAQSTNDQGPSDYQGTISFQPPEGTQEKYDASYDIWQLGFIMLYVLLRKKCSKYSKTYKPIETEEEYREIVTPYYSNALEKFQQWFPIIDQMIEYKKEKRPSLNQVIAALQQLHE